MTNKRKIQILEKVIKRFEKVVNDYDKTKNAHSKLGSYAGICNYVYGVIMTPEEQNELESWVKLKDVVGRCITPYFINEFKIKMPTNGHYRWKLNKHGYLSRINACKKAIERLSK